MKTSIKAVRERTDSLAEVTLCYTGDILNKDNTKYDLQYYVDLAKQLEDEGAHMLAVKDMAGLLKPYAAELLIPALKQAVDIPIHLHTHDTSSIQSTTYLKAIESGVDIVDCSVASMSGLTSQPNLNSMVAMFEGHERESKLDLGNLNQFSNYWENVREMYYPFESGLKAGTAEVYDNEIPGGQYSNLRPQAEALGLDEAQFHDVKKNYAVVNKMFGDIVKVTPSSKVVGDMSIFMTTNNLTPADILDKTQKHSFPESVINFMKGDLGQPVGGFPKEVQDVILKGIKPYEGRPNEHLEPVDFDKEFAEFQKKYGDYADFLDFLSFKLYPKVFADYYEHHTNFGYVSEIPTKAFFFGMKRGEEILISIDEGKTLMVKMLFILEPDEIGMRTVGFELNGQTRRVQVKDLSFTSTVARNKKVSSENEIGAPLQGKLSGIMVKVGDKVEESTPLFIVEAMKMETTIAASKDGVVKSIILPAGTMVEQDDVVIEME